MKQFLGILFYFGMIITSHAQFQHIVWQLGLGGNSTEEIPAIVKATDGNYLLAGTSFSTISGNKTEPYYGGGDYWVVKLDTNGNILWQQALGGSGLDQFQMIIATPDGGCVAVGYSQSNISGNKTETSFGLKDYWVVKLDATGAIEWQNTIGGSGEDYGTSVALSEDGGYLIGGYSQSPISGDKTENMIGGYILGEYDYWVVKLNAAGEIEWENTIGGFGDDRLSCILTTTDGGYILGGKSDANVSADKTDPPIVFDVSDYWLVKIDSLGNVLWDNVIGGSDKETLNDMQLTADEDILIAGYSFSPISGDKSEPSLGGFDYWIVKTDSAGNILWENTIGGSETDYAHTIHLTASNEILVGGQSESNISFDKATNTLGYMDYWLVKLDSNGILIDQSRIGGSGSDRLYDMLPLNDSTIIMAGYSSSNISGDKTMPVGGFEDIWLLEVNTQPLDSFSISTDTTICLTDSVTLTVQSLAEIGSEDYTIENIPFNPITIEGTSIELVDDGSAGPFNFGFEFCFFGNTYTQFYIGANGVVKFGSITASENSYTVASLPNTASSVPKNCIMGPWQDWQPGLCDDCVRYEVVGDVSPFRQLVITWDSVPMYSCITTYGSFQIILNEWDNSIENHIAYKGYCAWAGGTATQGIHNLNGTIAYTVDGRNASVWEAEEEAILYVPSGVTWYDGMDNIGVGNSITVFPDTTTVYMAIFESCGGLLDTADVLVEVNELSGSEVCDGIDNDCNGLIDDFSPFINIEAVGPLSICIGESTTLVAVHSGGTLQWYKGASPISGATGDTLVVTSKGNYKCILTSDCGSATSVSIFVMVNKLPPGMIMALGSTAICAGDSVQLKATSVAGLTYQWYKGITPVIGATSNTYFATTAGNYRCFLTFTSTGCSKMSSTLPVSVVCKEGSLPDVSSLELFPNPAAETVTIFIPNQLNSNLQITIRDLAGRQMLEWLGELIDGYTILPVDQLPVGTYLVEIVTDYGSFSKQLVIAR